MKYAKDKKCSPEQWKEKLEEEQEAIRHKTKP